MRTSATTSTRRAADWYRCIQLSFRAACPWFVLLGREFLRAAIPTCAFVRRCESRGVLVDVVPGTRAEPHLLGRHPVRDAAAPGAGRTIARTSRYSALLLQGGVTAVISGRAHSSAVERWSARGSEADPVCPLL